ncbi:MAG TPA: hypothetical protein DF427_03950 [Moraxellaceae bacterium]|nr:hypothetical protein [Moraxellaceae bacterium]
MKKQIEMMAAPTAMQPGGYVLAAYADHTVPATPQVQLEAERATGRGFRVTLRWPCATAVRQVDDNPTLFPDACALLVPVADDSQWITMGAPGKPVQGVLWRADRQELYRMHAEGLGTMQRQAPPLGWTVVPEWRQGFWQVVLQLPCWPELERAGRVGVAVWQGAQRERAGLKSVSTDWVGLS